MASISKPDIKKLWGKCGGFCAMCKIAVLEQTDLTMADIMVLGEMAHIRGEKEGSARYDSAMTDTERNEEANLLILCPTDHTKIDKDETTYTVEKLHTIKSEHEAWVRDMLREQIPNVTFAELEVTLSYLANNTGTSDSDEISFIKPKEKIVKNSLSPGVEGLIKTGMARVDEVKNYLNTNPDTTFAERLKGNFMSKYNELKAENLDADAIFYELMHYASGNSRDMLRSAAALSVVVYFFEACDIFEK